nr:hypothetical protein GCM10020063_060940 [Dactylosporangium thailandense]
MGIGDLGVELHLDRRAHRSVGAFVDRISDEAADSASSYHLVATAGEQARLVMDPDRKTMSLTLPPARTEREQATIEIGLLQALARGVAFLEAADPQAAMPTALLHGGAVMISTDCAIAVVDGGRGQGKTSLAMGLAARHGQLMVDEFAFVTIAGQSVTVLAAPQWPWHVRSDMAAHLVPGNVDRRLLFAGDFTGIATTAVKAAAVRMMLIPDRGLPAGETVDVSPIEARRLLRCAVTDHLRKLVDPRLDHVSIFDSPDHLATADGAPLHTRPAVLVHDAKRVLDALVTVPVIRVGIGAPADLPISVTAASARCMELLA